MTSRLLVLPFALGLVSSFVACGGDEGGDVGAPCNVDADCAAGLTCDEHEGQASCQEPHGHDGEETGDHDSGSSGDHASESGGHDSGSSGHGHDSGSSGHDSGSSGHDSGSGSESGSSTGA